MRPSTAALANAEMDVLDDTRIHPSSYEPATDLALSAVRAAGRGRRRGARGRAGARHGAPARHRGPGPGGAPTESWDVGLQGQGSHDVAGDAARAAALERAWARPHDYLGTWTMRATVRCARGCRGGLQFEDA